MAKEPKKKVVTRKDQSRVRKEQQQKRWIVLASVAVFALVFGVILFGLLYELVFEGMATVASVNDERITLNEFRENVRFQRFNYVRTYRDYFGIYSSFGPDMGASFYSTLKDIEFQLSDLNAISFGQSVLDQMIDARLISQYAEENGIAVSQAEVDEAIQSFFGYYPEGTPTPEPTVTPFSTATMNAQQYSLVSPTPEPTAMLIETEAPPASENATPEVAETPEEAVIEEASATPEATLEEPTVAPTLEPTLTLTPYTFEGFQDRLGEYVDEIKALNLDQDFLEQKFKESLLREQVYEQITGSILPEEEQVWARHILVETEETANEVLQRLDAGEDWTTLAAEYSTDTSNKDRGGDLGWFGRGRMVAPFEEVAFELEIGEISEPVMSDFGWHIIQVLGHDTRVVTVERLEQIKSQAFADWLADLRASADITIQDNWQSDVPVEPTIPPELILE